jgi:hypothetical protein
LKRLKIENLLEQRYKKLRAIGQIQHVIKQKQRKTAIKTIEKPVAAPIAIKTHVDASRKTASQTPLEPAQKQSVD